ncbi:ERAD-associated protein [Scheffersomyces spartinae]|uniref:ERAD-associated protein n=1 Tax=Scheffersomyces spartinae TaxID=45513 RepID=A0A9P7V653_9ASCO|nr:ERAD-associated protein [Scheffersomyces spartinae]KAG7191851.1 ERAD-associated protein [Scheffersomyces spartinae]
MKQVPSKYDVNNKVFNRDNFETSFQIPPYDSSIEDYKSVKGHTTNINDTVLNSVLPQLEALATKRFAPAIVDLADIYMFGNYSVPTNYLRAFELYQEACTISANGHANFMLGFIYSTGLFDLIPKNKELAILHYTIAFENGDPQALLTLAYRYHHGLGVVPDCQVAHLYYSRAVQEKWNDYLKIQSTNNRYANQYDISIADFKGGMFGSELSESPKSYEIDEIALMNTLDKYKDSTDDPKLHLLAELYITGLLYFRGDFLRHSDYDKALKCFRRCAAHEVSNDSHSYKPLINRCNYYIGVMHLNGWGVEKDVGVAYELLSLSTIGSFELGNMYENGLIIDNHQDPDLELAIEHYNASKSVDGYLAVYKILRSLSRFEEAKKQLELIINLPSGNQYSNSKALYEINKYWELGSLAPGSSTPKQLCEVLCAQYFRIINLETGLFMPSLDYALNELMLGNFKNALLGYLIAAEQGMLYAQISAATLLMPERPMSNQVMKHSTPKMDTKQQARFLAGMEYLELASSRLDVDSTILLGDIFHNGYEEANITVDHHKAYSYYTLAAKLGSPHAFFNLGYMYEYGYGPANNTVDYSMAKRNYDECFYHINRRSHEQKTQLNTIPVNLALLRVRLKHFFSSTKNDLNKSSSWWSALFSQPDSVVVETQPRGDEFHQNDANGNDGDDFDNDNDDGGEWFLILFIIGILSMLSLQMIRRRQNGDQPNANVDFQVHFVAL